MKIVVVCGMGLGSSHFVSMNVMDILREKDLDADVENCDLLSAFSREGDIFIGADYLVDQLEGKPYKINLEDLLDRGELEHKLLKVLEDMNGRI